ncbi:MAG: response regulator transcription factor [Bacteroidetes bacterium]|nr:response regulator transcription factor [Bacteroidota bacterium]MBS1539834.1 response regulator transcription factor [Bacteroidota bacterium]
MNHHFAIDLALVDDHKLFRKGLITLIEHVNPKCKILFEADDGIDLQSKLNPKSLPEILLMDINMPRMNGFETVKWLTENYPSIKVLVVSMVEKEDTIVQMLKLGVRGYLCKDVEPHELGEALASIASKGYYYTDFVTGKLVHTLQNPDTSGAAHHRFSQHEMDFIKLACSELTYVQIADKMCLSPKTIDGYRNSLFEKLEVKSRVGLVLYAVRNNLVSVE